MQQSQAKFRADTKKSGHDYIIKSKLDLDNQFKNSITDNK
jgi:hypothetical protein